MTTSIFDNQIRGWFVFFFFEFFVSSSLFFANINSQLHLLGIPGLDFFTKPLTYNPSWLSGSIYRRSHDSKQDSLNAFCTPNFMSEKLQLSYKPNGRGSVTLIPSLSAWSPESERVENHTLSFGRHVALSQQDASTQSPRLASFSSPTIIGII